MLKQIALAAAIGLTALGCLRVKVDPVEVKPITLNVNLKIDRELDDMFDAPPATRPAPVNPAQ
jgi:hypothetical protein